MTNSQKKKLREALFQHSMLESSVNWWEKKLDKKIEEIEKMPEDSPETEEKRKEIWQILRKLQLEEDNIVKYMKDNEETH